MRNGLSALAAFFVAPFGAAALTHAAGLSGPAAAAVFTVAFVIGVLVLVFTAH